MLSAESLACRLSNISLITFLQVTAVSNWLDSFFNWRGLSWQEDE